ncbi:MAG: PLD nuclease N-terminal domain-containing protein [Gordonia sp. (in: high G+C Gram-positive bacteria)]
MSGTSGCGHYARVFVVGDSGGTMPLVSLLVLAMWVIALIDVIVAEEYRVRHLPKVAWVLIVIFLPLVGSVIWFLVGRPEGPGSVASPRGSRPTAGFPEYERPNQTPEQVRRDVEEFQRQARERAESQRRKAKEADESESSD